MVQLLNQVCLLVKTGQLALCQVSGIKSQKHVVVVVVVVVVGCWLLVVGCWLLVVGCWLLVVGCWLLVVGCCLLLLLLLLLLLALLLCFGKEPCNAVVLGSQQVAPFSKCWVAWPRMPKVDTRWATVTMQPIPVGEVPWFGRRVRGEVREVRVNLCVDMICFLLHTVDGRNPAPPWDDLGCIHLANIFISIIHTWTHARIHVHVQVYIRIYRHTHASCIHLLHTYRQT